MNNFKKNIYKQSVSDSIIFNDPFDHMVVRFNYTKPINGTDLDIMVYYANTSTIYDLDAVGYNQLPNNIKIPSNSTLDANSYLWWALDDFASPLGPCVEAVVIGINKFVNDVPVVSNYIDIELRAGWYGSMGNGNIEVSLTTYLGGVMSVSGTDIINTGGIPYPSKSKSAIITSENLQVTYSHSNLVGTIRYNKIDKTAILI